MQEDAFLERDIPQEETGTKIVSLQQKLPSFSASKESLQKIVLEYLAENGYYKAFIELKQEMGIDYPSVPFLKEREIIRELAEAGEFLGVLEKTSSSAPFIFSDHPMLYFLIVKQDILEDMYIRNKTEGSILARIEKELSPVIENHPSLLSKLESLVGAIVFKTKTPKEVLDARLGVFQAVNKKMLFLMDYEMNRSLESLLTQTKDLSSVPSLVSECKLSKEFLNQIRGE